MCRRISASSVARFERCSVNSGLPAYKGFVIAQLSPDLRQET
jgi:hypothetical protein